MALLYWCLEGWTSHKGLANVCYLQFWVLWAQERSSRAPNWTFGFLGFHFVLLSEAHPPPSHPPPLLLPPAISLPSWKQLLKITWILAVWKLFTHTIIAKEWTTTCCNFHSFSIIHQEAIIQLILEIAVSPNIALCIEAGFCQIQSQMYIDNYLCSSRWLEPSNWMAAAE